MKYLLIVVALLFLVSCGGLTPGPSKVVVPGSNGPIEKAPEINKDEKNPDILTVDMRVSASVLDALKRAKIVMPVEITDPKELKETKRMCAQKRQVLLQNPLFNGEIDIILYGKHPGNGSFLCLPTKLTPKRMREFCSMIEDRILHGRDENLHRFSCRKP